MKVSRFWRYLTIVVAGLTCYGVFLLSGAPAEYLARIVATLSRQNVTLQQPSGSIWNGSGQLVVNQRGPQLFGRLNWHVHPWRLLLGSLAADMELSDGMITARASFQAGVRQHMVRDLDARIPVNALSMLAPATAPLGLGGVFHLSAKTISLRNNELRGGAEVFWEEASSRLLPITQTGEYRLQVTGEGKQASFDITTVRGPLQIAGKGTWRLFGDGALHLNGNIVPTPAQPALEPFLDGIAPGQPDGEHQFDVDTRIRAVDVSRFFP